ncbi:ABC transporter ATP-binding protein [Aureimonas leprariae]|uniref:ABC transporter ATP-binding protein n=1 Tax=Plantimonas leprariae TaxID=2615207 RepID=A0A7V7PPV2_9HYPH|nr:ABC transporter ATP-binding protein [Aureimonas leprariae]KAB0679992.1 ABC transporter ATP-binding protein [Aureimonas leprariae]
MASVELRGVSKSFHSVDVIRNVDLTVADGEFVVFVGPSGCGKSTLLRLIAGLISVSSGEVAIDGEAVTDVPASARGIAFVFQSYALYPHMNVERNIGFALETSGLKRDAIRAKVMEVAKLLKVDHLMGRRPRELSGGQRQRVAIGRALVRKPEVFLFDEPLSNLDTDLRAEMRVEIARLHKDLGVTTIYVTHDQVEAMTLADRIVVLNAGVIEQVGTPHELYHSPRSRFVAGFIGSPRMNFLAVREAGGVLGGAGELSMLVAAQGVAEIGVRPEALTLVPAGEGAVSGTLERIEDLGHEHHAYVRLSEDDVWALRLPGRVPAVAIDARVGLAFRPEDALLFGADGRRLEPGASAALRPAAVPA